MENRFASFDLNGKVALVTSPAHGIGRACALALAQAGADIALGLHRLENDEGLADEIRGLGRKVLALQMSVSKLDEIQKAAADALAYFKHIDILVNNAGIGAPNPAEIVTEKDFEDTLAVNLKGTFFSCQAIGKIMINQRQGKIINISSQAGFVALPTE